jgi:hypothetical protein
LDFIWIAGNGNLADWTVGQGATGQNQIASRVSPFSATVNSNLTLTSISGGSAQAVPEPGGWALFGAGLAGMGGIGGLARRAKRA